MNESIYKKKWKKLTNIKSVDLLKLSVKYMLRIKRTID